MSLVLTRGHHLTVGHARKLFNTIGFTLPMICLFILGNIDNNIYSAISLLIICVGFSGANNCGYFINQVDLTPNFAGTLMGFGQTLGTAGAIVGPIFAGYILTDIVCDSLPKVDICPRFNSFFLYS